MVGGPGMLIRTRCEWVSACMIYCALKFSYVVPSINSSAAILIRRKQLMKMIEYVY